MDAILLAFLIFIAFMLLEHSQVPIWVQDASLTESLPWTNTTFSNAVLVDVVRFDPKLLFLSNLLLRRVRIDVECANEQRHRVSVGFALCDPMVSEQLIERIGARFHQVSDIEALSFYCSPIDFSPTSHDAYIATPKVVDADDERNTFVVVFENHNLIANAAVSARVTLSLEPLLQRLAARANATQLVSSFNWRWSKTAHAISDTIDGSCPIALRSSILFSNGFGGAGGSADFVSRLTSSMRALLDNNYFLLPSLYLSLVLMYPYFQSKMLEGARIALYRGNASLRSILASTWAHADLAHLVSNVLALMSIAPLLLLHLNCSEFWFAVIFVGSAVTCALASLAFNQNPSIGASGAIYGVQAALIAFDRTMLRDPNSLTTILSYVIGNAIYDLTFRRQINVIGHIGGYLGGYAIATLYKRLYAYA